jgi:hypothetical protein
MRKFPEMFFTLILAFIVFFTAYGSPLMAKDSLVVNTYPSVAYINKQGEVDGPVAALIREVTGFVLSDITPQRENTLTNRVTAGPTRNQLEGYHDKKNNSFICANFHFF